MATFEEKWAEWKATIEKYKPEWKKEFLNWANDHGYGFNGGFFNEFPHTHYYETDLSWLIARMKWVLSRMDNVEERMAAVEELLINFIESLDLPGLIKDEVLRQLKEMLDTGVFEQVIRDYYTDILKYGGALEYRTTSTTLTAIDGETTWSIVGNGNEARLHLLGGFLEIYITVQKNMPAIQPTAAQRVYLYDLIKNSADNVRFRLFNQQYRLEEIIEPAVSASNMAAPGYVQGSFNVKDVYDSNGIIFYKIFTENKEEWKNGKRYVLAFSPPSPTLSTQSAGYGGFFRIPIRNILTGSDIVIEN